MAAFSHKLDANMNEAGYTALRESAARLDLGSRGKIRLHGEDRVRLLHAMTTNHIQQLKPGEGCYAFFLNAQGRILSDVNVFVLPEYLLLDLPIVTRAAIYAHLDKFIIADDVTLEDVTDGIATMSVEGPEAEVVLTKIGAPLPATNFGIVEWRSRLVARVSSTGAPGFSIFLPAAEKEALIRELEQAGVVAGDEQAAETVRLENHIPKYGVDFSEQYIPQETQLMHAIHFTKGCYIGQEIVERVRSRGHLNKMLVPVEVDTRELEPAAKLQAEGKEAGYIKSAAYSPALGKTVALAIIRTEAMSKPLTANGAAVQKAG
jgi:folate-binding protein YgfZ